MTWSGDAENDRWTGVEADLALQSEGWRAVEVDVGRAERLRAERAAVALADRLRAVVGCPVRLRLLGPDQVHGVVTDVGVDHVAVTTPTSRAWVLLASVTQVEGLGADHEAAGPVAAGWSILSVLRRLAVDREVVDLCRLDGSRLRARVDRVWRDHVDVSVPGRDTRRGDITVPVACLAAVSATG